MDSYEMKALVLRLTEEVWNLGHLAVIDELLSPGFVNHDPAYPLVQTRDELKAHIVDLRTSYPDFWVEHQDFIAEANKVVMRWQLGGTQMGSLSTLGVPPTGRHITLTGVTIYHWKASRLAESWWYWDQLNLLQQLGAFHAPDALLAIV